MYKRFIIKRFAQWVEGLTACCILCPMAMAAEVEPGGAFSIQSREDDHVSDMASRDADSITGLHAYSSKDAQMVTPGGTFSIINDISPGAGKKIFLSTEASSLPAPGGEFHVDPSALTSSNDVSTQKAPSNLSTGQPEPQPQSSPVKVTAPSNTQEPLPPKSSSFRTIVLEPDDTSDSLNSGISNLNSNLNNAVRTLFRNNTRQ